MTTEGYDSMRGPVDPDPQAERVTTPDNRVWLNDDVIEALRASGHSGPDAAVRALLAGVEQLREERDRLADAQERVRLKMLDAHGNVTEGRDTFSDGYFNGLASALDEFSLPERGDAEQGPGVSE